MAKKSVTKKPKAKQAKSKGINLELDFGEFDNFADFCEANDAEVTNQMLSIVESGPADEFMSEMAIYELYKQQEKIISLEHFLTLNPENELSNYKRVEKYKKEHQILYDRLKKIFKNNLQKLYNKVLKEENDCARANLDSSKGRSNSFVIPKFNPDGTHEPWNKNDVPWHNQ